MSGSTANNVTPAEIAQCTAKMQQMVAASKYFEAQKYGPIASHEGVEQCFAYSPTHRQIIPICSYICFNRLKELLELLQQPLGTTVSNE